MTLLIAWMLVYGFGFHWVWYILAFWVWVLHVAATI